jgi:hypothetical protein
MPPSTSIIPVEDAVPFKIDGEYCRFIRLSRGYIAIVSAEDYPALATFKWYAMRKPSGVYAVRNSPRDESGRRWQIPMHRQILGLRPYDIPEGDHANGNTLENRRGNLRVATTKQNQRNAKLRKDNKSGFKGVFRDKKSWRYTLSTDTGSKVKCGFPTAEAAFAARCERVRSEHGEFARFA